MMFVVKLEVGYMEADFAFKNSIDAVSFLTAAVKNLHSTYKDNEFKASMSVMHEETKEKEDEEDF